MFCVLVLVKLFLVISWFRFQLVLRGFKQILSKVEVHPFIDPKVFLLFYCQFYYWIPITGFAFDRWFMVNKVTFCLRNLQL